MAKSKTALLPAGYGEFLADIKQRVRAAQVRVVLAANSQMILLYWDIGRSILDRQQIQGWGAKVIDNLARDLKTEFPDMKGFSTRNLKYMRAFGEAWMDRAIVQQVVAQLPWGQNVRLLDRIADSLPAHGTRESALNMAGRAICYWSRSSPACMSARARR
jgi:predicted nuclease of restriction endonuclease-like (RecB) superfamily